MCSVGVRTENYKLEKGSCVTYSHLTAKVNQELK